MVLAVHVVDDLDAVAGGGGEAGAELSGRSPDEAAAVGDSLGDGLADGDDVVGGALEEKDGDGVGGVGRRPGDGEGLASLDGLYRSVNVR